MSSSVGRLNAAERRASKKLCPQCLEASTVSGQEVWQMLQEICRLDEDGATKEQLLELAARSEAEATRLRVLAAQRP